MMDSEFKNYLKNQSSFREKWKEYISQKPRFDLSDRLDSLTPFYGMSEFQNLTEKNKNDLFINYVRLIAESLIVFEQVLLFGFFTNRRKERYSDEKFSKPFAQFTFEELYHSMAFRHFLKSHHVFSSFPKEMITKSSWLKNTFAFTIRRFPGALYICSPRLEALSLSYFNEINKAYGPSADNSWLKLHRLHYQDEVHHIPLNYHFHDAFITEHGLVKTWVGAVIFFVLLQVMLLKVAFETISQSFPEKTNLKKVVWTFKFIKWSMKFSKAHIDARVIMKKYFIKLKPQYSYLFSFLIK